MEPIVPPASGSQDALSRHRILIIHPPKMSVPLDLRPHEIHSVPDLESSDEAVAKFHPDVVACFAGPGVEQLESHVMTWLVEGFKGKLILLDPHGEVGDRESLVGGQVVDDYFAGPISPQRFMTVLQSKLLQDTRFAAPRAMTTYDLFRNLFDRGLSGLFFFTEELDRCVAANLRAEELTGYSFAELKAKKLQDLCHPEDWNRTLRVIRRAKHRYYDVRGFLDIVDASGNRRGGEFGCGYFQFGRKYFVKVELQALRRDARP